MEGPCAVNAIVLRSVNYRDNDRMLTLFTQQLGKLSAVARGAHRTKSALRVPSTQFCLGEYLLMERQGRFSVTGCTLDSAFYPLREDPVRLAYATLLAQLCEEVVQDGQPNGELFALLLRSLTYLSMDGASSPRAITLSFLVRMMQACGQDAVLDRCAVCGGPLKDARFDCEHGGAACRQHAGPDAPVLTPGCWRTLRDCQLDAQARPAQGEVEAAYALMRQFVEYRLERPFKGFDFVEVFAH